MFLFWLQIYHDICIKYLSIFCKYIAHAISFRLFSVYREIYCILRILSPNMHSGDLFQDLHIHVFCERTQFHSAYCYSSVHTVSFLWILSIYWIYVWRSRPKKLEKIVPQQLCVVFKGTVSRDIVFFLRAELF